MDEETTKANSAAESKATTPAVAPGSTPVPAPVSATTPPIDEHMPAGLTLPGSVHMSDGFKKEQQDIANILKGIKLPERKDFKASADIKTAPKQIEISPALSDEPAAASPKQTEPAKPANGESPVVSMHTLRDDLKHVVRDQNVSMVRAVALEQQKRGASQIGEDIQEPRTKSRAPAILFAVGLFSLLGLAALGGVYFVVSSKAAPLPVQSSESLVFAEQSAALPLDNVSPNTLKNQLAQARGVAGASLGSITRIVPLTSAGTAVAANGTAQQRPATFTEFMNALGAHPPSDLLRALSDTYFLGVHTVDKNAPVLVVPVTSYDHAFSGMLDWEQSINSDLSPFFAPLSNLTIGKDGIPTQRSFSDLVMRNYDVRALKDDNGQVQLYYSFPTRNVLIIAESPYTFTEIITRLQALKNL